MSRRRHDLTGRVFNGQTVLREAGVNKRNCSMWYVQCSCGSVRITTGFTLNNGTSKSCGGCKRGAPHERHGLIDTPEYHSWQGAVQRCHNPNSKDYPRYGARGITVCDRWRMSFVAFLADMGPKPSPDLSLDRQDNGRGYEPGNVEWGTAEAQARNRRSNRMIEYQGETVCAAVLAERHGVSPELFRHRLYSGWSVHAALQPLDPTQARPLPVPPPGAPRLRVRSRLMPPPPRLRVRSTPAPSLVA